MELKISHPCPSCGGPINMDEMDRLTTCAFCDVQNYMVDSGLLRYVLTENVPVRIPREDVFYLPYLRFKGNIFSCRGRALDYRVLDTTHQGIRSHEIPVSLGLRPQAMRLVAANRGHVGKFVIRKDTAVKIMQRAAKLTEQGSGGPEAPLYHRAFIGESVSCIYLPVYTEKGRVYDGVLNRPLGRMEAWIRDSRMTVRYRPEWDPRFIAAICPQCGAVMEGSSDSLILQCFNCHSCCAEKGGKFVLVPYTFVASEKKDPLFLPFWRLEIKATGLVMNSFADFLKITNQPVVINRKHRERDMEFWIPAFKIRPKIFLKLAKSATLLQIRFPEGEKKLHRSLFPVTLPLKEATQAMKSVVAETTLNKKEVISQLPSLSFTIRRNSLVFLPFEDTGHDLVQEHAPFSIASSVIKSGRNL
ncbi:MAG: hypothetical protein CSA26_05295 [Desulfobacterales bacterium]|nr:MAG: hypothetical protein CSA26_05295 [Desulfobacterales bacterium]